MYKVTNVTTNMILAGTFYFCLGLYVPGKYHLAFWEPRGPKFLTTTTISNQ